ncbi:MAG: hypothetical protein EBZ77_03375 [Chitinophagia bacterium]|nr:hypothetical protein [Chitinophagia bacterium]
MLDFARNNLICVCAACALSVGSANGTALVTEEEATASREAVLMVNVALGSADLNAPVIELVTPDNLANPIKNPFVMEISFVPKSGSIVDFSTFKAFYGAFKIDITDRLMKQATRTEKGLKLDNVSVPSGYHSITLMVKDKDQHTVEKQIKFRVE